MASAEQVQFASDLACKLVLARHGEIPEARAGFGARIAFQLQSPRWCHR